MARDVAWRPFPMNAHTCKPRPRVETKSACFEGFVRNEMHGGDTGVARLTQRTLAFLVGGHARRARRLVQSRCGS